MEWTFRDRIYKKIARDGSNLSIQSTIVEDANDFMTMTTSFNRIFEEKISRNSPEIVHIRTQINKLYELYQLSELFMQRLPATHMHVVFRTITFIEQ